MFANFSQIIEEEEINLNSFYEAYVTLIHIHTNTL